MKKIFIVMISLVLLITACGDKKTDKPSNEKNEIKEVEPNKDAYSKINKSDIIINTRLSPEFVVDYAFVFESLNNVAIITIESIDGGDTYPEITTTYNDVITYGKMKVVKTYKGDLKANDTIGYIRSGGIVPYDKYAKWVEQYNGVLSEEEKTESAKTKYYDVRFEFDVHVEVGKTYLVFLDDVNDYKIDDLPVYYITLHNYGLLEVVGDPLDPKGTKVIDPISGETIDAESLFIARI